MSKDLKQYIVEKLGDSHWGAHQEVKLFDTRKKPDWIYLYANGKAILLEDKEQNDVGIDEAISQLKMYEDILRKNNYSDILMIAIKDNGSSKDIKVFRNNDLLETETQLKNIDYYTDLLGAKKIYDITNEVFKFTARINKILYDEFKMEDLRDRMEFTGCILLAAKNSKNGNIEAQGLATLRSSCSKIIRDSCNWTRDTVSNVELLLKDFNEITIGKEPSSTTIEKIVEYCKDINDIVAKSPTAEIDIMNIFFTEFNRYQGKSKNGAVFTPPHICQLMAKLLDISKTDQILDPCMGSGSLLLKCASENSYNFRNIHGNDLIWTAGRLAYLAILLQNGVLDNLMVNADASSSSFGTLIKKRKITKLIANPPYENSLAIDCLTTAIDNMEPNGKVCWLMPNNKINKKMSKKAKKDLFSKHSLTDIILLGDIFPKTGCGDVSLFLFTTKVPQGSKKIRCWHIDDEFETVKNQGYQDVKGKWPEILQTFLEKFIKKEHFDCEIDSKGSIAYPKKIEIKDATELDFEIALLQNQLFEISNNDDATKTEEQEFMLEFMKLNNQNDKFDFLKKIIEKGN